MMETMNLVAVNQLFLESISFSTKEQVLTLHKKWSFPLRITSWSTLNYMTISPGNSKGKRET